MKLKIKTLIFVITILKNQLVDSSFEFKEKLISDKHGKLCLLVQEASFYKFRRRLHFVKKLVGDDPQTPEIVIFVDG